MYTVGQKMLGDAAIQIAVDGKKQLRRIIRGKVGKWQPISGATVEDGHILFEGRKFPYAYSMVGTKDIELVEASLYLGEDFDLLMVGFDFYKVLAGCSIKIPKKEVTRNTTYVTYKSGVFKFSKVVIADSKGGVHDK